MTSHASTTRRYKENTMRNSSGGFFRAAGSSGYRRDVNMTLDPELESLFETGKMQLQDKRYKDAIRSFSKCVQFNNDALFYRAVAWLDSELPEKAISDFNELLERCPDYSKTVFNVLSIAYRRVGDYTGALRTLSRAIASYPRYLEAYVARG